MGADEDTWDVDDVVEEEDGGGGVRGEVPAFNEGAAERARRQR